MAIKADAGLYAYCVWFIIACSFQIW